MVTLESEQGPKTTKRASIAEYNLPLRASLRSLESILSSPSPSRSASITAVDELSEVSDAPPEANENAARVNQDAPSISPDDPFHTRMKMGQCEKSSAHQTSPRLSDGLIHDVGFILGSGLNINSLRLSDRGIWDSPELTDEGVPTPNELETVSQNQEVKEPETSVARRDQSVSVDKLPSGLEPPTPSYLKSEWPQMPQPESTTSLYPLNSQRPSAMELVEDLNGKVLDWKGHKLKTFGSLILYDVLQIQSGRVSRRIEDRIVHHYHCYLFERILLCCKAVGAKTAQEKSPEQKPFSDQDKHSPIPCAYKLKGRINMEDVKAIEHPDWGAEMFWKESDGDNSARIRFDDQNVRSRWIIWLTLLTKIRPAEALASEA